MKFTGSMLPGLRLGNDAVAHHNMGGFQSGGFYLWSGVRGLVNAFLGTTKRHGPRNQSEGGRKGGGEGLLG